VDHGPLPRAEPRPVPKPARGKKLLSGSLHPSEPTAGYISARLIVRFPNNFIEKALGVPATTRNWSTIVKIAALVTNP